MATIKEIAEKAGVSIGTVDRVLHNRGMVNAQTKERVESVMRELNYRPNQVAQGLAVMKKKLKIGFFIPGAEYHPYFQHVARAAQKKAKELAQYGVQVNFYPVGKSRESSFSRESAYWHILRELDGIVTLGMDTPDVRAYMEETRRLEIPVVFYNTYMADQEFLAYVGCDYEQAGRLAAGLAELVGGEDAGVCIYSEGNEAATSHRERIKGFCREAAERYPGMKILDICQIEEEQEQNEASVREMFCRYPDVNVVYVVNPRDYEICRTVVQMDAKRQVKIITNDIVEDLEELMRQGSVSATICQEPEKQGEQSLEILFQYLAYGTLPKEKMCYTDLSIHIAQNL